ncbi:MAG: hypothetical protein ACXWNI_01160 [Candidatus Limnocylindrales bacterium]
MTSGRGRSILALVLAGGAVAFTAVWALPNIAGASFVQVRAVVTARAAAAGPTVVIGGGTPVQADAVDVSVEVDNRYPLGVVLGTGPTAFRAAAYQRDANGKLVLAWQVGAGDPTVEEGSDSPVGGGPGDGAIVVPSGVTRHGLTQGSKPFSFVDARGALLASGVYYLRVWAYGIGSPLVPMALGGGTDPLGTPTDLPALPGS